MCQNINQLDCDRKPALWSVDCDNSDFDTLKECLIQHKVSIKDNLKKCVTPAVIDMLISSSELTKESMPNDFLEIDIFKGAECSIL